MNKVTIEGTEYNVVPSPDGGCHVYTNSFKKVRCVFTNRPSGECQTMPCREPTVIFLTDANFVKHFITTRLTE